jgi:hypothetical protein
MLVVNVDGIASERELFAAHSAGRPATDNDVFSHQLFTQEPSSISGAECA